MLVGTEDPELHARKLMLNPRVITLKNFLILSLTAYVLHVDTFSFTEIELNIKSSHSMKLYNFVNYPHKNKMYYLKLFDTCTSRFREYCGTGLSLVAVAAVRRQALNDETIPQHGVKMGTLFSNNQSLDDLMHFQQEGFIALPEQNT